MFILSSQKTDSPVTFFQKDGLVDIFIGLGIFFAGLFLWTEIIWMIAIFIPAFLPSLQAIRKRVIEPRIGKLVTIANQDVISQKITLYVSLIMGISVLAGFCIFFVFEIRLWHGIAVLRQYILLMLGMIFVGLWIFVGAMLLIRRYLLYAALTFVLMVATQFADLPLWITFVILGGMIIFVGVLVLLKFLKKYPHM